MKYLKMFEGDHVSTYRKVSYTDFMLKFFNDGILRNDDCEILKWIDINWIEFTNYELEQLKVYGFEFSKSGEHKTTQVWKNRRSYLSCPTGINKKNHSSIIKRNDEWFGVTFYEDRTWTYYICDQWDGLMSCLNTITKSISW